MMDSRGMRTKNDAKIPKKVIVKMKGEAHEYDSNRPKKQLMSRYAK